MTANKISRIEEVVKSRCEGLDPAHDWDHIKRVRKLSLKLYDATFSIDENRLNHEKNNQKMIKDRELVEIVALLHDVGDFKFGGGQGQAVTEVLQSLEFTPTEASLILDQVSRISWRKSLRSKQEIQNGEVYTSTEQPQSALYKFVSDADRLDAMGNIGIARCFAYGGSKNAKLYDLSELPNIDISREEYDSQVAKKTNTLNHFYEKLFKLKDSLETEEAKKIGEKRHRRMIDFVDGFLEEVS